MGFFKKIFKGVKKVFKGIGKVIKKVTKPLGKLINKMGIFGQIGMFVLSIYAGPVLFSALKSSVLGPLTSFMGKGLSFAKGQLSRFALGRKLIAGASRIASAAKASGAFVKESIGSIAKGVKNMITTTVKAGAEKLGMRAPTLTSVKYDLAASQSGSGITATSADAITAAAGGDGYGTAMKNVFDQVKDDQVEAFWDLERGFTGKDKYGTAQSILKRPDIVAEYNQPFDPDRDVLKDFSTDYSLDTKAAPSLDPLEAVQEAASFDPNLPFGEQGKAFGFAPSPQAFTSMPTAPTTDFAKIGDEAGIAGTNMALQSLLSPGATSIVDEVEAPRQVIQDRSDFTRQIAAITSQQANVFDPITQFGQPFQYQPWAMQSANDFYNASTFDTNYGRLLGA